MRTDQKIALWAFFLVILLFLVLSFFGWDRWSY
jgi:hypothetical protein